MTDWANLPEGVLDLMAQHIHQIKDLVVMNSVCKSWQFALTFESPKFPLLMLDDNLEEPVLQEEENAIRPPPRCFFNLFTSKVYELDLTEAYSRKCLGIGFGWLLTVGLDSKISLLHPLLRQQICLSPQSTFPVLYDFGEVADAIDLSVLIKKASLSSSPQQESCVIMVLYSTCPSLAFARLGTKDKSWIDVPSPTGCYDDLIYYEKQFYAVDCHSSVVVCDINDEDDPKATVIAPIPIGIYDNGGDRNYLVELSGNLMLILRIYGGSLYGMPESELNYYTRDFLIFKMEPSADLEEAEHEDGTHEYPYKWVKVNDLGNRVLFLGNNSSVSYPASSDLKANCIYFTDDNEFVFSGALGDMGIFNIEDGTIDHYYTGPSHSKYSPSLWYI